MNKKIFSAVICVILAACVFAGCGNDAAKKAKAMRVLYSKVKLSDYVELTDYDGLSVDTSSDDYKEKYDTLLSEDVDTNDFYADKGNEKIENGDKANIDYTGKKDGVAFDGGTAEGYDLKIGSGSFISGFEEGLVGAAAGQTLDLNLTFPESYSNEELAGKAVVFTVKVNSVKTPEKPEEYYKKLSFNSEKEYYADVNKRAAKQVLLEQLGKKAKVKDYPKDDYDTLLKAVEEQYGTQLQQQYGITLETYLQYTGSTIEDFRGTLATNVLKPMMDEQLAAYALLDKEGIPLTSEDADGQLDKLVKQYGSSISKDDIKSYFGDYYFEALAANEKAAEYLYENAKIK